MISYKQWKTLNESILPNFNLGIAQNVNPEYLASLKEAKKKKMDGDDDLVEPARDADKPDTDEPDVDVKVADDTGTPDAGGNCDSCSKMSKKKSKKSSKKMSKKKMWTDEDDAAPADPEEGDGEEEDMGDEKDVESPDDAPEEGDDVDMSGEEDDGEEGEEDPAMKNPMKDKPEFSKKKSKKKLKKESAEESWLSDIKNMMNTEQNPKYSSGCESLFTPIDTSSLTQAVRPQE